MTKKPASCFEYQQQDPAYQALTEQIADLHRTRDSLEKRVTQLLWDTQAAIRAIDACQALIWREPESEKSDKDIEAITGESADCWSSNWGRSADMCRNAAANLCQQVAAAEAARLSNREQIDRLIDESNDLAAKLRREWHKQQEAIKPAS